MKSKKKRYVIFSILTISISIILCVHFSQNRNDWFEYCTTRAYGLPFPWIIENCLCDGRGGQTTYPIIFWIFNVLIFLIPGIVISVISNSFFIEFDEHEQCMFDYWLFSADKDDELYLDHISEQYKCNLTTACELAAKYGEKRGVALKDQKHPDTTSRKRMK